MRLCSQHQVVHRRRRRRSPAATPRSRREPALRARLLLTVHTAGARQYSEQRAARCRHSLSPRLRRRSHHNRSSSTRLASPAAGAHLLTGAVLRKNCMLVGRWRRKPTPSRCRGRARVPERVVRRSSRTLHGRLAYSLIVERSMRRSSAVRVRERPRETIVSRGRRIHALDSLLATELPALRTESLPSPR